MIVLLDRLTALQGRCFQNSHLQLPDLANDGLAMTSQSIHPAGARLYAQIGGVYILETQESRPILDPKTSLKQVLNSNEAALHPGDGAPLTPSPAAKPCL